jgi:hypothetical protein
VVGSFFTLFYILHFTPFKKWTRPGFEKPLRAAGAERPAMTGRKSILPVNSKRFSTRIAACISRALCVQYYFSP